MNALEIAKKYYQDFNSKNYKGMLEALHPEIKHESNQGSTRVGKIKFEQFLKHMDTCYDENLKDLVFMSSSCGTRVGCEFVVHGTYKATDSGLPPAKGQKYQLPAGSFFEIRHGKIYRITTHYNLPAWIAMVK